MCADRDGLFLCMRQMTYTHTHTNEGEKGKREHKFAEYTRTRVYVREPLACMRKWPLYRII